MRLKKKDAIHLFDLNRIHFVLIVTGIKRLKVPLLSSDRKDDKYKKKLYFNNIFNGMIFSTDLE